MTRRESLSMLAFLTICGGLLISTPSGRAFLGAPWSTSVPAPRWVVWIAAFAAFEIASQRFQWRLLRVAVGFLAVNAWLPVALIGPPGWTVVQEALLLAIVVLLDFHTVRHGARPPQAPPRNPAVAVRPAVFETTSVMYERRRMRRAQ